MKFLPLLFLFVISLHVNSAELDSVSLITPVSYKINSSMPANVTSQLLASAAATFKIDIEKKVTSKIAPFSKDLEKYFPKKGELDSFVKTIVQEGIKTKLPVVNDANLIGFYKYLGNNLIGKIADKILEKEGIADAARRALWVDKLTAPFNNCVNTSHNSQFDANHCIDALTSSLVPNIGSGIVYELSRASLNSSLPAADRTPFNIGQAANYKVCIDKVKPSPSETAACTSEVYKIAPNFDQSPTKMTGEQIMFFDACVARLKFSSDNVMSCALGSMKTGVSKVTNLSFSKTVDEKASTSASSALIKKAVWSTFEPCIQKVGSTNTTASFTEQFMVCIDKLAQNTGSQIVMDKITSTGAIKDAFTADDVKKLAQDKSAQFAKCAEEQRVKGARKDGMLDIDRCENGVTNEITYKVVAETLRASARDSIKADKSQSSKIGNEGVQLLDKCWSANQTQTARESCLRKTIVSFSQIIAKIKLNEAIPENMPGKANLAKLSVTELAACVEKELPANISESNDMSKKLDGCSGKLTHNVALKVADFQIRDTAKGNLSEDQANILVKKLVEKEFADCIGTIPSEFQIILCSDKLTVEAAAEISDLSFTKEVKDYLVKSGGMKALNVTQTQVDNFLNGLSKSNSECLKLKLAGPIMNQVNACIKGSIKKIAFFFGDIQFNKSIGSMYAGKDAEKKVVEVKFKKSLGDCLALKDAANFSISDFTKNLYTCSDKVSASTTLVVGADQVNSSLENFLKDRPGMNLKSKRDSIRSSILGNFKSCLDKATNQATCIDSLKKDATTQIVLNYGRIEIKSQINADQTPTALLPTENALSKCTNSKLEGDALTEHLDICTKDFALGFAKELGTLKLNYLLKQALGTNEFEKQKKDIEASIDSYTKCLLGLKRFSMNDGLTDKLSICTDQLTNRGMAIVRSNINNWMTTDQKDAATTMIKQEFANLLPCLSALIPASPFSQNLSGNVDSTIKPIAAMLAHYIEYNPESAKETLDVIIKKFSIDFNDVAATKKAKKELLDFLYEHNGLDQFIKAMVRGTVKDSLIGIPEKDIPNDLRAILLKKENFEVIFNSPDGKKIKELVMDKLLKPALLENDVKTDVLKTSMEAIKDNVVKLLINSPNFGEQAIKLSIQKQINDMNGVTKFFAKALYGGQSLNWDKVRLTPEGIKAEEYIKENVLTPKFKGVIQSTAEQKKVNDEAEKLVKKAVKSFG